MSTAGETISVAGVERVDELRELWLALHHHHHQVAALQPLVDDDDVSWERRRSGYLDWLAADEAFLVVATDGGRPVGYAMVHIEHGPDDTWPVAERYAEIYSLSVAPHARGRGVGTRLCDFVDAELSARGIEDLQIAVMVGNADAQRFYERRGLRPGETVLYRFGPRSS